MRSAAFIPNLESAQSLIAKAEAGLEKALGELRLAPRAEKVRISDTLECAFAELRSARAELARVEALIAAEDT
jgi:hypothetical protein